MRSGSVARISILSREEELRKWKWNGTSSLAGPLRAIIMASSPHHLSHILFDSLLFNKRIILLEPLIFCTSSSLEIIPTIFYCCYYYYFCHQIFLLLPASHHYLIIMVVVRLSMFKEVVYFLTFASVLAVVFPTWFVSTNDTLDILPFVRRVGRCGATGRARRLRRLGRGGDGGGQSVGSGPVETTMTIITTSMMTHGSSQTRTIGGIPPTHAGWGSHKGHHVGGEEHPRIGQDACRWHQHLISVSGRVTKVPASSLRERVMRLVVVVRRVVGRSSRRIRAPRGKVELDRDWGANAYLPQPSDCCGGWRIAVSVLQVVVVMMVVRVVGVVTRWISVERRGESSHSGAWAGVLCLCRRRQVVVVQDRIIVICRRGGGRRQGCRRGLGGSRR